MSRRRRSVVGPIALGLVAIVAAVALGVPILVVDHATKDAIACFEGFAAARGPKAPDCRPIIARYVLPSRIPWTARDASYRAEELSARQAIEEYKDALVGTPSREAAARAMEEVEKQQHLLEQQSQRITLQELGPTIGAPNVGHLADDLGDRAALLAREQTWLLWPIRLRTLEAALLEGDVARATKIARHYASFDPRDEDLRLVVASFLCLGGEHQRSVNFLRLVQDDRAKDRHENFARGWGDARWLMVACARLGGIEPAPKPERAEAGRLDRDEARAVLRLEVARRRSKDEPVTLFDAAQAAMELLREPRAPRTRLPLLAALLASGYAPLEAQNVVDFATPRTEQGEPDLAGERLPSALAWLDETRGVAPIVSAEDTGKAAARLDAIAKTPGLAADAIATLAHAKGSLWLERARVLALAGDATGALAAIDKAGDVLADPGARALARSSATWLAGDAAGALVALAGPLSDAHALRAAALAQRAELFAITHERDEAARAARDAGEEGQRSGDSRVARVSAWARLAFAPEDAVSAGDRAVAADVIERRTRYFPWETPSDGAPPELVPIAPRRLALALVRWDDARKALPDERRALRYGALGHRGDVPDEYLGYLAVLGAMLAEGEGDRELWLDVATIHDTRRMTLRRYAWSRAQAARARGDEKAAAEWSRRYEALRAVATDPARAELARYVGM